MKLWVVAEYIIRTIVLPIFVVLALNYYNICDYLSFVPQDEKFDIGLMIYLGIAEGLIMLFKIIIKYMQATIECVFYIKKAEEDISFNPTIYCTEDNAGVAMVSYHLRIEGSPWILKNSKITIQLQEWISSQSSRNSVGFKYNNDELILNVANCLPKGYSRCSMEDNDKLAFIHNNNDHAFGIEVIPRVEAPLWARIFITFNHNTVYVKN